MFAPLSQLFPLLGPEVPDCPNASMEYALAHAAAEFCERTHLWRESMYPDTTRPGEHTYPLVVSGVLEAVESIVLDGDTLASTHDTLVAPGALDESGKPTHYWLVSDTSVRLFPTPDSAYSFSAQVVLKPAKTTRNLPAFLVDTHGETITSGAAYRLARIPGKAWTNPDVSVHHKHLFERGIARARVRDFRTVPLRVAPRPFV